MSRGKLGQWLNNELCSHYTENKSLLSKFWHMHCLFARVLNGITFRLLKLTYLSKKNKPEAKDKYLKLYLPCSSSTTSFHPSLARWYATEQPTIPPPQTTTCACFGTDESKLSPSWELEFLFAWSMEDDKSLPGLI